ncbi:MAG: acetyl-CoA C-acyltransferase [Candidatus Heimdallarchaeota archaeon]
MELDSRNIPVIVSAVRTPIGKYNKSLKSFSATKLGSLAIKNILEKINIDINEINEVIMGQVLQAGSGQAPARQSALYAGLPETISAVTINKVCGSGLKSIMLAAQAIKAGDAEIIIAGGQESMTNTPYYLPKARFGYFYGSGKIIDGVEFDGLLDPYNKILMGHTGEIIAEKYNISREQADEFTLRSHKLAVKANNSGFFKKEIVPLTCKGKKKKKEITKDDGPREDTNLGKLAKLKPAFKKDGIVTAGNASSLNDGASAVLVMSKKKAHDLGFNILATIRGYNTVGVKPEFVMEAPILGVKRLLKDQNLRINDIDLVEHNEAFASASVAVQNELNIPEEIFNVNGGAVALGHPLGCSGARILTTLIHELNRRDESLGIATVCLGGGNAVTMAIER